MSKQADNNHGSIK